MILWQSFLASSSRKVGQPLSCISVNRSAGWARGRSRARCTGWDPCSSAPTQQGQGASIPGKCSPGAWDHLGLVRASSWEKDNSKKKKKKKKQAKGGRQSSRKQVGSQLCLKTRKKNSLFLWECWPGANKARQATGKLWNPDILLSRASPFLVPSDFGSCPQLHFLSQEGRTPVLGVRRVPRLKEHLLCAYCVPGIVSCGSDPGGG